MSKDRYIKVPVEWVEGMRKLLKEIVEYDPENGVMGIKVSVSLGKLIQHLDNMPVEESDEVL